MRNRNQDRKTNRECNGMSKIYNPYDTTNGNRQNRRADRKTSGG